MKHPVVWLVIALLAVYAQTLGFEFLRFDDPDYVFANPFVRGGLSWENVCRALTDLRHGAVWMPVTWLVYMTVVSLFGCMAGAFHLVNLSLHIVAVFLLLKLCRQLHGEGQAARNDGWLVFAVAFWALHPQRVEAVAWVASLKELLWSAFTLAGLCAWVRGARLAACVWCALASMSKPTAMVFPVLALVLDGALAHASRPSGTVSFLKAFKLRWRYLPLFMMALATGLIAIYSQTHPQGMATKDLFYAGFFERLLNAAVALGLYLAQMLLPLGLHLDYRAVPGAWPLDSAWGLGALAAAVLGGVIMGRRALKLNGGTLPAATRCLLIAGIWFLAALLPTLGLFASFGEHARADRFLYVPAMALPVAVALWRRAGAANLPEWVQFRRFTRPAAVAILVLFSVLTYQLAATYHDDTAAFTRSLACDGDHGRALAHVGEARCAAGKLDEGIELLRHSRRVRPRDNTDGKLAYALMRRGRSADWREIREVCAAFIADPARDSKGQVLEALGTAELCARQWQKAADYLARSIMAPARFYSADDAKLKLGFAWHNGGRRADAKKVFTAMAQSTRADLAARAERALQIIARSPAAILFW